MVEETILTAEGLKKLEDELELYKTKRRQDVAERLKIAISYGDISENSEYDDAKNEQAFIEGHILELEKMIRNAKVIKNSSISKEVVSLGSVVLVEDLEFNEKEEYSIVGTTEADPANNKISNESPIGKALLGAKKGSTVEVNAPAGVIKYQILSITK